MELRAKIEHSAVRMAAIKGKKRKFEANIYRSDDACDLKRKSKRPKNQSNHSGQR